MKTTLAEGITAQLRTMLLSGELPPGMHLIEATLAQQLGVSRTPLREALRALAKENLLIYLPNRGYEVRRFALQDILDAYDVRGTLEAMACRLAAEKGLDEEAQADIAAILRDSQQLLSGEHWTDAEHKSWRDLNASLHKKLLQVAGNRQLLEVAMQMRRQPRLHDPRLTPETSVFQTIYPVARARRSHEEHVEIIDAIFARQGARAEALMREHVWRNRESLRKLLPYLAMEEAEEASWA